MRLTRKLGMLLTVPLVATIAFAALAVSVAVAEGVQAQRLQSLVSLAGRAGDLARVLQSERATAVALVVSPGGSKSERVDAYLRASKAADESVARYRQELSTSAGIPSGAGELLDRLDAQLKQLPAMREARRARFGCRVHDRISVPDLDRVDDLLSRGSRAGRRSTGRGGGRHSGVGGPVACG